MKRLIKISIGLLIISLLESCSGSGGTPGESNTSDTPVNETLGVDGESSSTPNSDNNSKLGIPSVFVKYEPGAVSLHWNSVPGSLYYRVLGKTHGVGEFSPLVEKTTEQNHLHQLESHLFDWEGQRFKVEACNDSQCNSSVEVSVTGGLPKVISAIKGHNTHAMDGFGNAVALSQNGTTMAVGAVGEDSNGKGVNTKIDNDSAPDSGAVYIFEYQANGWIQTSFIKASNSSQGDHFGGNIEISDRGDRLVVSAYRRESNDPNGGIGEKNDITSESGAVYVFDKSDSGEWLETAYIKPNAHIFQETEETYKNFHFGRQLTLNGEGTSMAIVGNYYAGLYENVHGPQTVFNTGLYIFDYIGGEWEQTDIIQLPDNEDQFIDLHRYIKNDAWVSIDFDERGSQLAVGYRDLWVFNKENGEWSGKRLIKVEEGNVGWTVSISRDGSLLTAGSGLVNIFRRKDANWNFEATLETMSRALPGSQPKMEYPDTTRTIINDSKNLLITYDRNKELAVFVYKGGVWTLWNSVSNSEAGILYGALNFAFLQDFDLENNHIKESSVSGFIRAMPELAMNGDGRVLVLGSPKSGVSLPQNEIGLNPGAVLLFQ